ncbi:MAG: serine/threonine protein kinase [Acidimicrobiales bacterium]|nr:serine/threonine protein kinase [Acidimicrobiales bacterium]
MALGAGHTAEVHSPLPALTAGAVVSRRYRLEAHLGSGATSAVWRARDLDLGRVVALKALLGADVDPELANRFQRESTILGRLSHPNVVPVLGSGDDEGRPYLIMELVDGISMAAVLDRGTMPVDEALDLVADVAAGLGAAHRAGVVHRDVKPANIVCGHDGVPRLVDFGIARAADLTSMTMADSVLGTASYLSPEQARGEVPGPASDVYALGCVLFEALTGRPPFEADSPLGVAYRHVHDAPISPRVLRPEVPAPVEAIVLRCLAKDPGDRYAHGAELEAALRRVRAGEALADAAATVSTVSTASNGTMVMPVVAAAPAGELIDPSPLAEPPLANHRRWGIAAVAAVAVVVLGLLLGNMGGDSAGTPGGATNQPTSTTTSVATLITAPPTTAAPAPPARGKKKHGKGND